MGHSARNYDSKITKGSRQHFIFPLRNSQGVLLSEDKCCLTSLWNQVHCSLKFCLVLWLQCLSSLNFLGKSTLCCNNSEAVFCSWNIWCYLRFILGKAGQEEKLLKSWNLSQQLRKRWSDTGVLPWRAQALCQFVVHILNPRAASVLIMIASSCIGLILSHRAHSFKHA